MKLSRAQRARHRKPTSANGVVAVRIVIVVEHVEGRWSWHLRSRRRFRRPRPAAGSRAEAEAAAAEAEAEVAAEAAAAGRRRLCHGDVGPVVGGVVAVAGVDAAVDRAAMIDPDQPPEAVIAVGDRLARARGARQRKNGASQR